MNYFYEIAPALVDTHEFPSQYMAVYDVNDSDAVIAGGYRLTMISIRIWKEEAGVVRFVKNRYSDIYDTHGYDVDMAEFMMVKLRAQALR